MQLGLFEAPERLATAAVDRAPDGAVERCPPVVESPAIDVFCPPLAERQIRLGDRLVGYRLARARRRSIGFRVQAEGLSVSAPRWIGIGEIESALHEKSRWILRKLAEQQARSHHLAAARIDWRSRSTLPYLGAPLVIVVVDDDDHSGAATRADAVLLQPETAVGDPSPALSSLRISQPPSATPADLRQAVQRWLQRQAHRLFAERCAYYAARLGVRPGALKLSSARTRWGSASVDGTLRLNWRLIHFPLATIDYVVVHELAHLREMNHGPRFWAVVRSVYPEVEAARQVLKAGVVPLFD